MAERDRVSKITDAVGVILYVAGILCMCVICSRLFTDDIWYDEVFSLGFIRYGYADIASLTAMDVHPPLYYMYLKTVTAIGTALVGESHIIVLAKLASALPWLGLLVVSVTYIRRKWGLSVSGIFLFFVTAMPQICGFYGEIRMYSFALLLVSINVLLAVRILSDGDNALIWILFLLSGIMTAYTQYYACIAIIGTYIAIFTDSLIYKNERNRTIIRNLIISAILSVIAYLPWLPVLRTQMGNISGKYWIQPLTIRSLAGCIKFLILPATDMTGLAYICAVAGVISVALIVTLYVIYGSRESIRELICLMCPILIVIISGFILSAAGTPIFIYRYMIPAAGGLWLAVAICAMKAGEGYKEKHTDRAVISLFPILLMIPLIIIGLVNVRGFYGEERWKEIHIDDAMETLHGLDDDAVIVANFDHVASIMGYYLPDNTVLLYDDSCDQLITRMNDRCGNMATDEDIDKLLRDGKKVYFFGSFTSRDEITDKWGRAGIGSELMGEIFIERYWINIYSLSVDDEQNT